MAHAEIATSVKALPHKGRFHACDKVHAESWEATLPSKRIEPQVRLVIRRAAPGFNAVLKMDREAAALIAVDLMKRADQSSLINALQSLTPEGLEKLVTEIQHAAVAARLGDITRMKP